MQLKRKYLLFFLIGVVVLALLFFSGKAYHSSVVEGQIKRLDSLKIELKERDKAADLRVKNAIDSVLALESQYKDYYNDYVREYNKRRRLESEMRNIVNMRFDRELLDSLADHYRYTGNNLR